MREWRLGVEQVRVVTARRGAVGKEESLETKERRMREWRLGVEQECRVQKGITELHPTFVSAVYFGPGEQVPHPSSGAAHRRATRITGTSGTAAVGRTSVGCCA